MNLIKIINLTFFIFLWIGMSLIFAITDSDASTGLVITTLVSTLLLCVICAIQIEKNLDKQIKKQLERETRDAAVKAMYELEEKLYDKLMKDTDTYKVMSTKIPIRSNSGKNIGEESFSNKFEDIAKRIIRSY